LGRRLTTSKGDTVKEPEYESFLSFESKQPMFPAKHMNINTITFAYEKRYTDSPAMMTVRSVFHPTVTAKEDSHGDGIPSNDSNKETTLTKPVTEKEVDTCEVSRD
jgi:hypothetical protein